MYSSFKGFQIDAANSAVFFLRRRKRCISSAGSWVHELVEGLPQLPEVVMMDPLRKITKVNRGFLPYRTI